jgi:hypothetical protein
MGGGGVHWAEWIVPFVGGSHMLYNAAANPIEKAVDGPDLKVETPGSPATQIEDAELDAAEQAQEATRQAQAAQAEEERIGKLRDPSPESRLDSIKRARASASANLGGGKRRSASQTLTDYAGSLGV